MTEMKRLIFIPIAFLVLISWGIWRAETVPAASQVVSAPEPAPPALPTCGTDWTLCKDNAEIANKYSKWPSYDCRDAANNAARYGKPEWPWLPFNGYYAGDDYVKTGIARLFEPDAQFSNGYGAKVHTRVECTVDLRDQRVVSVRILGFR